MYSETPRGYHSFSHALDVLERVDRMDEVVGFVNLGAARLAALFHDATYVAGDASNEAASAVRMAFAVYDNYRPAEVYKLVAAASRLIEATAQHMAPQDFFTDWDTMLFLDCDMLGFAETGELDHQDKFDHQQGQIELEFRYALGARFDQNAYDDGRLKFLTALRAKGVFRSPFVKLPGSDHEARALGNISRACDALRKQNPTRLHERYGI
jgi:predicted metal-dependent HD superfamily phosphohydrolase